MAETNMAGQKCNMKPIHKPGVPIAHCLALQAIGHPGKFMHRELQGRCRFLDVSSSSQVRSITSARQRKVGRLLLIIAKAPWDKAGPREVERQEEI